MVCAHHDADTAVYAARFHAMDRCHQTCKQVPKERPDVRTWYAMTGKAVGFHWQAMVNKIEADMRTKIDPRMSM